MEEEEEEEEWVGGGRLTCRHESLAEHVEPVSGHRKCIRCCSKIAATCPAASAIEVVGVDCDSSPPLCHLSAHAAPHRHWTSSLIKVFWLE